MSTTTQIAALLGISTFKVQTFCEAVNRAAGRPVSHENVLRALRALPPGRRTVAEVVRQVQPQAPITSIPTKTRGGFSDSRQQVFRTRTSRNDPRDHTEGLEKCPHGVLKIHKCAICDPDEFDFYHG